MKVRIIENTDKRILEENVNFFLQQVKNVISIQYTSTYLADVNDVLKSAMIIYE